MKGDFSRLTFVADKHYDGVRMQQGRVQLDADWNEQRDIDEHLRQTTNGDMIGCCGVPQEGGGFAITADGDDLRISPGRIYVDGVLCELDSETKYTAQQDYPNPELHNTAGTYLVYLDVWRRHITALEDPQIREVALGGPDTATRSQIVAQVKLIRLGDEALSPESEAAELAKWEDDIAPSTGELRAKTTKGYQGSENQLYRVEIHQGTNGEGSPTFKWSRDNGSLSVQITEAAGDKIIVASLGRGVALGLRPNDCIELLDDDIELSKGYGELVRIKQIDAEKNELTLEPREDPQDINMDAHPKLRRWDMPGGDGAIAVTVPAENEGYLMLENGIEIKFEPGTLRSGDYWQIPVRTATADVEWPSDESDPLLPKALAPHGIRHHYGRLAMAKRNDSAWEEPAKDCRSVFQPLVSKVVQPPAPKVIRVEEVILTHAAEPSLENDSTKTTVELISGSIQIHCDTVLASLPTSSTPNPVCFVTLDVPLSLDQNNSQLTIGKGQLLGYQRIQLAGTVEIGTSGKTIEWTADKQATKLLFTTVKTTDPLLAHLTIKGKLIRANDFPHRYLDGAAFGERGDDSEGLRLPNGLGRPGSDFEMWFWVKKPHP